eukprot:TRINITY_DN586_c0_g1_i12.p1 TRINITY_DN586_c0_g1~~TRINITY_DN586_c0_g1_i12.p1  ORF type:complete len:233 (-),score=25.30 TRINITY_DN586_c0_g1_i12:525-1223(-)
MEYADGGDLLSKVRAHEKGHTRFSEQEIWRLFAQICLGLEALHKMSICHRDIKCANIFLSKGQIKIGDLNISKVVKSGLLSTQVGTPCYTSPEIWNNKPYSYKSDMWSLGCVLYELCALRPPFLANSMRELSRKIIAGVYHKIPSVYSADLSKAISDLLKINPAMRLSSCTSSSNLSSTTPGSSLSDETGEGGAGERTGWEFEGADDDDSDAEEPEQPEQQAAQAELHVRRH